MMKWPKHNSNNSNASCKSVGHTDAVQERKKRSSPVMAIVLRIWQHVLKICSYKESCGTLKIIHVQCATDVVGLSINWNKHFLTWKKCVPPIQVMWCWRVALHIEAMDALCWTTQSLLIKGYGTRRLGLYLSALLPFRKTSIGTAGLFQTS